MVPSWTDQLLLQLLMEQFDTLPMRLRHIDHMHDGVWLKKKIDKMTAMRTLTIIPLYGFCICMDSAIMGRSTPTTAFDGAILILCQYNVNTLNTCMKEFIIFVCTDSTEVFFSKLRSAGLNYNLPSFSPTLTVRGVSNKHCLLTFFIMFVCLSVCLSVNFFFRQRFLSNYLG